MRDLLPKLVLRARQSRSLRRKTTAALDETKQVQLDFLRIELEIALAFAGRALITNSPDGRQRNRASARRAYDTFKRMLRAVSLEPAQAEELFQRYDRLRAELHELGESV